MIQRSCGIFLAFVALLLGGCGGTAIVAPPTSLAQPTQLHALTAVWDDQPVKTSMSKRVYPGGEGITAADQANGRGRISTLTHVLRTSTPPAIHATLQDKMTGREGATDARLVFTPIDSFVVVDISRGVGVDVALKDAGSGAVLWKMQARTGGFFSDADYVLRDRLVTTVLTELSNAGWIPKAKY